MEFIETPTFTRLLASLLTDDEYRALQNVLVENPARGDLIPGIKKDTHFSGAFFKPNLPLALTQQARAAIK